MVITNALNGRQRRRKSNFDPETKQSCTHTHIDKMCHKRLLSDPTYSCWANLLPCTPHYLGRRFIILQKDAHSDESISGIRSGYLPIWREDHGVLGRENKNFFRVFLFGQLMFFLMTFHVSCSITSEFWWSGTAFVGRRTFLGISSRKSFVSVFLGKFYRKLF